MIDIIIPIYKENPNNLETISITQTFRVLDRYDIFFVHPRGLDISFYKKQFPQGLFHSFDDHFFCNILGYNELMLSKLFYNQFQKQYILICQPDAFLFKDDLDYWVDQGYDYVGAPWLRSRQNIPYLKKLWDNTLYFLKSSINYQNNGKSQKNKSLLYNEVGNGGLSLRNRNKCLDVIHQLESVVRIYLKPENASQKFYAEDVFFSVEPSRHGISFSKPDYKKACLFAIENKQEMAMKWNQNALPFGCHRWDKELHFWKKYIEAYGYNLDEYEK
ncbi:DUF5672 family protein [Riemerella columbina]|uniref:DUF5672 family protein n=1 Tax=Riemerella columbina TaxID=103810 RepID=UPI00266F8084|nr:DUF5672 family protein [Riemerella columbina]WKS95604.1 hypothetical protein NYR17_02365 [Riemerella columbina]